MHSQRQSIAWRLTRLPLDAATHVGRHVAQGITDKEHAVQNRPFCVACDVRGQEEMHNTRICADDVQEVDHE